MPRKNILSLVEGEQVRLVKEIDNVRAKIKEKTRELLALEPNLTDLDPPTVKLLLSE